MSERHVVIVGGGLAGLSAGCYARASGFRTTVVERDIALRRRLHCLAARAIRGRRRASTG